MNSFSTSRLLLKKIAVADAAFYYELFNSEGWLRFIGDRNIKNVVDAKRIITERYLPSFEKSGYGSFTVILKENSAPIGTCGFYKRDNLEYPDIGFAFLKDYTGKGYGFEAATALIKIVQKEIGFKKYLAFTVKENKASINLLKKLGMHQVGPYHFDENPTEELLLFSNK